MQAPTLGSAAMSKLRTADGIVPSFVTETEKTIFETAPIGVVRIDNGLRISYANAELHKICGATPGTLLGQEIWTMLPDERSRQIIHQQLRLRAAGESADYEVEIIRQDNSRRIVAKVAGVPLVGVDGDMIGTIGLVRDVTGLTGRDRILKDNDKCTDWGEVLAKLAARIGELIPYDEIAVTLYSRDRHLAQVIYWTDGKGETISQTQNWYTIEPVVQDWLKSLRPRLVHDLSSFYRRYRLTEWLTRKDSPVARGLKSSVYLPIAQEHALIASVALLSRQTRGFGRYDIRLLTSLPLKETVQLALYYRQVKEERFKFEILQRITASSSADELAQMLVTDLIQHYGWDNASLAGCGKSRSVVLPAQFAAFARS